MHILKQQINVCNVYGGDGWVYEGSWTSSDIIYNFEIDIKTNFRTFNDYNIIDLHHYGTGPGGITYNRAIQFMTIASPFTLGAVGDPFVISSLGQTSMDSLVVPGNTNAYDIEVF